jgi:hypothetical protein
MAERPHGLLDDDEVICNLRNSNHYLLIPSCGLDLSDLISSCWQKCDYDRPSFCHINHFFLICIIIYNSSPVGFCSVCVCVIYNKKTNVLDGIVFLFDV